MAMTTTFTMRPIGVARTPHTTQPGTPIQPRFAEDVEGVIEVFEPYADALRDLDGFERIWLVFALHLSGGRSEGWEPVVVPFRDTEPRGLFATRAPRRPNPIGLSAVRLLGVDGRQLRVGAVDLLDGTPILDIKPYVPLFDAYPNARAGWIDARRTDRRRADGRFD